ncbi:MAG: hypothetical protein Q8898_10545 [Bacillota bacterium]|nr:hypothetical protein [Bacillota bacterium]
MNSKMLAAVGISGLLMAGGVISASASTSGYDLFKTAVKKTHTVNSFTAHVQASLVDNKNEVYTVDSTNKENLKSDSGSSSVSVTNGGKTTQVDFYNQNHQSVIKSSDDAKFYVRKGGEGERKFKHKKHKGEELSPQMQNDVEGIFDALTKNYQDSVTSKDLGNGNTELELTLSKSEIPAVGQAVASFFLKNLDQQKEHMDKKEFGSLKFSDLKPQLPKLQNNIVVSSVDLKGQVNADQYLTGQEATISVSGDEANGTHHDLVLHITSNLDNLNKTEVTGVSLKGEKVVQMKEKHDRHED